MRFSIKRLFSRWNLDNIKVVRRVIVSVVGATVLLIGIALLVLPGTGVRGDSGGTRNSRHGVRLGKRHCLRARPRGVSMEGFVSVTSPPSSTCD